LVAGAALVLADPVVSSGEVLAVVDDDGGVRVICAGWLPQDDVSDVNVTAVYKRASLAILLESCCGS
jgi:glutamate mutase epsilon subunit